MKTRQAKKANLNSQIINGYCQEFTCEKCGVKKNRYQPNLLTIKNQELLVCKECYTGKTKWYGVNHKGHVLEVEAVKETPVYIHTNEEGFKRLRKQHRLGLWLNDKKLYNWSKNHKDIMKILEHIKRRAERDIDFMIKNIIFFGGKPSVDKHLVEAYRTVYDTLIFIQQEEFGIDPLNNNPESKFMETMIKKLNDKIIEKFNLK